MGANISLDYITHQFSPGADPTIKDFDNKIHSGELVALIGRSGCGKSTLLHMMAGLILPSGGCVRINGHQVTRPSAKWNMMFQKASLYPWMTVRENAALGLIFSGMDKVQAGERVDNLLDLVGLHDKKNVNVQSLSGGQQQRVALARSLATEPDVLLLDEPFSALDAFTRGDLQSEVPTICQNLGITIVIVTHDIDEAIAMADRVLIMSQNPGRLVGELDVKLSRPRVHSDTDFQLLRDELMERFKQTDDVLSDKQLGSEAKTQLINNYAA
jgi:ABC-type nitrate/sulfonate/bicarbonate transport system ATPase subunit